MIVSEHAIGDYRNRRLIVACPKMLKTLKTVRDALDDMGLLGKVHDRTANWQTFGDTINAAINAAEGK